MRTSDTENGNLRLWIMLIAALTVMLLALAGCGSSDSESEESETAGNDVLYGAALVGYFDETNMLCTDISKDATVEVYNAETEAYEPGELNKETIEGNFLRLKDTDGDEKADLLQVVKFEDSDKVWDPEMRWLDGVGKDTEPALSDESAKAVFTGDAAEQRIPFGERLLSEHGIGDYSGVNDFNNIDSDEYWCHNNWYTQKSGGSLILLEGFKTQMQSTGAFCVSATGEMVLEWYGQRNGLNERDFAAMLPDLEVYDDGAIQAQQEGAFKRLAELGFTCDWTLESCLDGEHTDSLKDPEYIKGHLKQGHPIILNWNSWGSHATIIIGYDDMGTQDSEDDVLIIADPYDTTDQLNDGYNIEPYARVAAGLSEDEEDNFQATRFLVVYPSDDSAWEGYTPSTDGEVQQTYEGSPYYPVYNFAAGEGPTDTLSMIKDYKTIQQESDWASGEASVAMLLQHFGKGELSDAAKLEGDDGRPAFVSEITGALQNKDVVGDDSWTVITNYDTEYVEDDEIHYLNDDYGFEDNLVPYLIEHNIPAMIGWDEWGGHWQTIIGYDDMGTEPTQDDVLILADSRDTTDHHPDGYVIEGFERVMFGFNAQFEENDPDVDEPSSYGVFVIAFPDDAPDADTVKSELGL